MDWALHQNRVRFDIRAEREEYARLFVPEARVLHDRMVRRGHTDRTRVPAVTEWEKTYRVRTEERKVLFQARVLGWGKEKKYYFAHCQSRDQIASSTAILR